MNPHQITELRNALKASQQRNPDAFQVLSAVAGINKKRIKEIVDGAEPTPFEFTQLSMLR